MNIPDIPSAEHYAQLEALLGSLDPTGVPVARSVGDAVGAPGSAWQSARRLVVLTGSFNPLHRAHLALLAAGIHGANMGATAALALSVRTIDKDRPHGMALVDRAWTMLTSLRWASQTSDAIPKSEFAPSVALFLSHGLYVDQARALRTAVPTLDDAGLWFVIGHDKVVQILDSRYYDDRDRALTELFSLAGLLVAPRDGATVADLDHLRNAPENRAWADSILPISLSSSVGRVSSTSIRLAVQTMSEHADGGRSDGPVAGESDLLDASTATRSLVPPPVAAMIAARRCY